MSIKEKMQRRLKFNRPSLRARARPPKQRTHLGQRFSAANLPGTLVMQRCSHCGHVQYPPTELCSECLADGLLFTDIAVEGVLLQLSDLHHSLWEFFKRRMKRNSWRIGSVKLNAGPTLFCHLADRDLTAGSPVQVFSHTDASQSTVLIAVAMNHDVHDRSVRLTITEQLNLTQPALRRGGI